MKTIAGAIAVSMLLAGSAICQTKDNYLDYYIVKVKPEKRADFDAAVKKIVDANRRGHGDNWLAFEAVYGQGNTVYFSSTRKDMAAIDTANENFMKAMKETLGANFVNVFRDMEGAVISSAGEIRRRRWDLSYNVPDSQEELLQRTGMARFIRVSMVRVRPGHGAQYEELRHMLADALAKRDPNRMITVSQAVAGQTGTVYYIGELQPSIGAFEQTGTLRETLGEEAYNKYQQGVAECVLNTETIIGKILPELSNPPEATVNVTRDFWMPQPAVGSADRMAKPVKAKK
jgi:hypothetical protein